MPEPYIDRAEVGGTYFGPIRVPAGAVFLLGDQRFGSVDSRSFGPVPVDSIVGRVVLRVWPRDAATEGRAALGCPNRGSSPPPPPAHRSAAEGSADRCTGPPSYRC